MIDFFERLPGLIVGLGTAHPFLAVVVLAAILAVVYIVALRLFVTLEDARDVRNRRK